ncbi:MAG TPA: hypothetical protein GX716_00600 [Firmicutes bacterium]|nr:hypothetical protein [Candidatus Fermentithermobacillaceae bacterium]
MDWGAIGNLSLGALALAVLAWVVVQTTTQQKKAEAKPEPRDESPTIPADAFAKMVAAAVSEANKPLRDLVNNNTQAVENNTKAINDMRVSLAETLTELNGKSDMILRDTNHLLQRRGVGQ